MVGPDGRPIAGLRLVPRSLQRGIARMPLSMPEEWRERLTVTTDANGAATIPYLSRGDEHAHRLRCRGPGIARIRCRCRNNRARIDYLCSSWAGPGRLVGIVRTEIGSAAA